METNIQIFKNSQFGEVRVTEINDEPMFVAADVCKILGYTNTSKAITDHTEPDERYNETLERGGNMLFINESGLYSLIIRSNKDEAKPFRKWVTSEVIPSIRKTGGYMVARADETPDELLSRALLVAQTTLERQKQRVQILEGTIEHQQEEIKTLAPKAEYTDTVLQSTSTYTMTQVAKELGMSAIALEKKLHDAKVIFKQSGRWILYAKYQDKGYTRPRTHHYTHNDGTTGTNTITVWTERGRAFIHSLFDKNMDLIRKTI